MSRFLILSRLSAAIAAGAVLAAALPAAAAGDPAAGKAVFTAQCAVCHSAVKGAKPILGPTLYGVVGRKTATMPGFVYSPAMKAAGGVWTADRLATYIAAPAKTLPGVRMTYGGLKNPAQLQNLIAYLNTLK